MNTAFPSAILWSAVRDNKDLFRQGEAKQVTPLKRRKHPSCTNSMFALLLLVASQASGTEGLISVIRTVPMDGKLTVTVCPGCNIVGHSLSPVDGVPSSVFTKKTLPTGLPLGSYQLFN